MYQAEKHQPARIGMKEEQCQTDRLPSADNVQLVSFIHDRQKGARHHWIEARVLMGEVYLALVASPWGQNKLMVHHISPDPRFSFPMIEGHEVLNDPWISRILELPSAEHAVQQLLDYFVFDVMSVDPKPFNGNAALVRQFIEHLNTASDKSVIIKAP